MQRLRSLLNPEGRFVQPPGIARHFAFSTGSTDLADDPRDRPHFRARRGDRAIDPSRGRPRISTPGKVDRTRASGSGEPVMGWYKTSYSIRDSLGRSACPFRGVDGSDRGTEAAWNVGIRAPWLGSYGYGSWSDRGTNRRRTRVTGGEPSVGSIRCGGSGRGVRGPGRSDARAPREGEMQHNPLIQVIFRPEISQFRGAA